jgi:hypothetical protein
MKRSQAKRRCRKMPPKSKRARLTIRLENEIFEKLKAKSDNISGLARDLIINHLDEDYQKASKEVVRM